MWSHQYCLACDKQVENDGAAYCSEACRLTEFESSTPSSQVSSPGVSSHSNLWSNTRSSPSNKMYLAPAYDFSNARPYGSTTPVQHSLFGNYSMEGATGARLSPSSSHSSLCSMRSSSTNGESNQVSDKARKELQAYAVSFDHVRTQRRRSY